ncbi:bifunctional adenosylcobinamide kinase/adenosylcobinamide-phosphate guanylyltransferase [Leptolyngbya sp. FACHB-36]|uniref:bifunctional adenosylcobinamide kinase/adenosylcobinamide-phosphate guanylyltransferase n=1 Tax=Leptolyngbya sp. FACHB-36 TaxID=2692808 RepID=UPI0016801F1A|nr:bifunctional adenosylcobinamide kinase/adenosylcobinamide-phosphate guanylyltransferase [Leptolyngbya sp. FACHB-36]MBD2019629.1 bifunctional adenosylcobinamide kinase/adenosylcobinamide-phosphate guanylyltransferase [Leptolyngbya sp. FACHB-36]
MSTSAAAPRVILVTGPARSGKSEWAETLASRSSQSVTYVATAQIDPTDLEWQARIEQHRLRRPSDWVTLHVPIELADTIATASHPTCLLIDSLGTWLANGLEQDDTAWNQTVQDLLTTLRHATCRVVIVAEETGWGVVPAYAIGRTFRDRLGSLTRQIGAIADEVYLVTGGYVLNLSALGTPLPTPTQATS